MPRVGDTWTYVAIDADTKLVPSFLVGKRTAENTNAFVADVASRMRNRVQLSRDGLRQYIKAIGAAFGPENVDKTPVFGAPEAELVSTSYIERHNLTMRMSMRRFTRLTNGFSKKLENHRAAVALHVAHYNLVRTHRTLRVTPAMAAGVDDRAWEVGDLLDSATEHAS
jgi:IS1 family transposase